MENGKPGFQYGLFDMSDTSGSMLPPLQKSQVIALKGSAINAVLAVILHYKT